MNETRKRIIKKTNKNQRKLKNNVKLIKKNVKNDLKANKMKRKMN